MQNLSVGRCLGPSSRKRWCGQWLWYRRGSNRGWKQVSEKLFIVTVWCTVFLSLYNITFLLYREENLAKIARRVKDYKVEEMNPPRPGKRLLVLDVDYTLFGKSSIHSDIISGDLRCSKTYLEYMFLKLLLEHSFILYLYFRS